jgi:transposase
MKHPPETVERARVLRRQGYGYVAIGKAIGVGMSTAYKWTRDLPIVTADAFDGRCRPLSPEHRSLLSAALRKKHEGVL